MKKNLVDLKYQRIKWWKFGMENCLIFKSKNCCSHKLPYLRRCWLSTQQISIDFQYKNHHLNIADVLSVKLIIWLFIHYKKWLQMVVSHIEWALQLKIYRTEVESRRKIPNKKDKESHACFYFRMFWAAGVRCWQCLLILFYLFKTIKNDWWITIQCIFRQHNIFMSCDCYCLYFPIFKNIFCFVVWNNIAFFR